MLDFDTCNQARLRRDATYDGLFFIGVRTTRIYCRPVCKVKQPMTRNIVFFPTAAAAEDAGFRPCLRCRPESAPFCPAWNGTRTTVARALRLIELGALDDAGMEALCERLGIGSRHLTRLFTEQLGTSPARLARTLRTQRAKRLIDEGVSAMAEVARLAGFGSVRAFNRAITDLYGRSPSALRSAAAKSGRRPVTPAHGGPPHAKSHD